MNNTKFFLSMSLIGLIPLIGYLKKRYTPKTNLIDRKIIIEILKSMKKIYYPLFKQIAFLAEKLKKETNFKDEHISNLILSSGKPTYIILKKINQQIFQSYKLTKDEFQNSLEKYKVDDVEINLLVSDIELEMSMALKGKLKGYSGEIPVWLNPNKVLIVFTALIKIQMKMQIKIYKQHLLQGITLEKDKEMQQQLKNNSLIDALLQREGLNYCEENGSKILHAAVEKYYNSNFEFKKKINDIKQRFQQIIIKIESLKLKFYQNTNDSIHHLDSLANDIDSVQL